MKHVAFYVVERIPSLAIIALAGVILFAAPSHSAMFCSVSSQKGVSSRCDIWDDEYSRTFAKTLTAEADCTDPQEVGGGACAVVYCKDFKNGGLRVWTCCSEQRACERLYEVASKTFAEDGKAKPEVP
jgi:hypothetical protein